MMSWVIGKTDSLPTDDDKTFKFTADKQTELSDDELLLEGNVHIYNGASSLKASKAIFNSKEQLIKLYGISLFVAATIQTGTTAEEGLEAIYNMSTDTLTMLSPTE